jgi:hypothetical protein
LPDWLWAALVIGFGLTIFFSAINAANMRDALNGKMDKPKK